MRSIVLVLLSVALSLSAPPRAIAQSDPGERSMNELRRENERLRERVEELESQLARASQIIRDLQADASRLRRQIDRAASAAAPSGEPRETAGASESRAPTPDDPGAAPEALYRALRADFLRQIGEPDLSGERARKRYLVEARRWSRIVNLRHREPVEWLVRLESVRRAPDAPVFATMRVLDPSMRLPIGDAFRIPVPTRFAGRLEDGGEDALWRLEGVFAAETFVREDLPEPNLFGEPRMIASHVVFDFSLSLRSLVPAKESPGPEANDEDVKEEVEPTKNAEEAPAADAAK